MNIKTNFSIKCLFGLIAGLCISAQVMAATVVIVNPDSGISSLTSKEIQAIYLGKSKRLTPVSHSKGSAMRKEFISKVLGKSESQFASYWNRKIFSGKGVPPKELNNSAEVKRLVARSSNVIGFIDSNLVDGTVKVVYTVN